MSGLSHLEMSREFLLVSDSFPILRSVFRRG